jgi:SNF2 family DNA or RNA helicase
MQSFMHIVESDVLQLHNIKYLTLTGAMTAKQRLETVD